MRDVVHDREVSGAIQRVRPVGGMCIDDEPALRPKNNSSSIGEPELTPLTNGGCESPGHSVVAGSQNVAPEKCSTQEHEEHSRRFQIRRKHPACILASG